MKKIGVLTSGGDSPGMNAAIRAVIRSGLSQGLEVYGIHEGYYGLHKNCIQKLALSDSAGIVNKGGTVLGSARYPEFKDKKVREQAIQNLKMHGIDGLVVIGGDGSYAGANALTEMGFPCVGLPGTIDNDIAGTDYTIGFMTALNTILDAIDKLRDTSASHQRISIVEVMGRHCGDLAMMATIAGGCDYVITPEKPFDKDRLVAQLKSTIFQGKKHAIVVITERLTDVMDLAKYVETETGKQTRSTILGYTQRGGNPTGFDRMLSARMGDFAVKLLLEGNAGVAVGWQKSELVTHDFTASAVCGKGKVREDLLKLAENLY